MKTLSLKLNDTIFGETEKILSDTKQSRNGYINEAIKFYNRVQKRRILEKMLITESKLVKKNSVKVLQEFEEVDYAN